MSFLSYIQPSAVPTAPPTPSPSSKPTTSYPTPQPSPLPTEAPTTAMPTSQPTTGLPSKSPSTSPTSVPTPEPTHEPSKAPSKNPTFEPTQSQATSAPTTSVVSFVRSPVASVVGKSSTLTMFGCGSGSSTRSRAIDENTDPLSCTKSGGPYGFVLSPFHKQLSNVRGIRVYSSKHYPARDPVTFVLEGRVDEGSPWQLISQGDLPWIAQSNPQHNPSGNVIYSTYESGDTSWSFTEAAIPEYDGAYLEYKVTVTTRKSSEPYMKFAEI